MKFDLFYQLPASGAQTPSERYQELIAEAVEADRLGYDTLWLAEIHFVPHFCTMSAPMMLLATIAGLTKRIRLGQAVNLLPLHQPARLAEEAATLDVISGGRLAFGAGRGGFPINYRGLGVDMRQSREMFAEMIDFLKQAWQQERVTFHGRFFNVEDVEVTPKPVQQPFPSIRIAANSPDTFKFAGANGYPIFSGGPVNPITVLPQRLDLYRTAMAEAGATMPQDWLAMMMLVFAGKDRASVRSLIEPSLHSYFTTVSEVLQPGSLGSAASEFERVRARLRSMKYETIDSVMGVFGDPEYCIDRIAELRERFGFERMVCWIETGGLVGHQNLLASMRFFAERVMPHFA